MSCKCPSCPSRDIEVLQIDASKYAGPRLRQVQDANARVKPENHHTDCPVKHGASATCVWPIAVCVYECRCLGLDHRPCCYEWRMCI